MWLLFKMSFDVIRQIWDLILGKLLSIFILCLITAAAGGRTEDALPGAAVCHVEEANQKNSGGYVQRYYTSSSSLPKNTSAHTPQLLLETYALT